MKPNAAAYSQRLLKGQAPTYERLQARLAEDGSALAADPIAVHSKAARVKALRQGNLAEALAQGEALVKAEPKAWTLRLMIACKEDTLKGIPKLFQEEDPDLFVLPVARRSGQTCTQVFVGRYPSAKDAEAAIGQLPAAFQVKGNRPKAFLLGEIPRNQ